jgi:hypothetical protein
MKAALEAADASALMVAASEVALLGPVRITRIGATLPIPPPVPVRDRVNQLMHELQGTLGRQEDPEGTGGSSER